MNRKYILIIILILSFSNNIFCKKCDKYTESLYQKIKVGHLQKLDLNVVKNIQKIKLNVQNMELIVECIVVGLPKMKMITMGNVI